MRKFYTENAFEKDKFSSLHPKRETIKFLLDYSAALKIVSGKNENFEMFAN